MYGIVCNSNYMSNLLVLFVTINQITYILMETSPKDYVDTLDSDNSLEFYNSVDFEELWNYYVYANSKDSKDAPNIVTDYELCKRRKDLNMRCQKQQSYGWANYEELEENKVILNNAKILKNHIYLPNIYLSAEAKLF